MRDKFCDRLERARITDGEMRSPRGKPWGAFKLTRGGADLVIIASDGKDLEQPWEHVSVSIAHRCPNWLEMSFVKDLFWREDECVIQYHPPRSEYVNDHPYCLHLWKPPFEVPTPPTILLGFKGTDTVDWIRRKTK